MEITRVLASNNFLAINKDLIKQLNSAGCAIFLCELLSLHNYFEDTNQLENGFFYATIEKIQDVLCMGEKPQKKYINTLLKLGLIECKVKGIPARRFFKINKKQLADFTLTSFAKTDKQETPNGGNKFLPNGETRNSQTAKLLIKTDNIKLDNIKTDIKENNNINIIKKESVKNEKFSTKKLKFGEFQRVLLAEKEYSSLIATYGKSKVDEKIKQMDYSMEMTNNKNGWNSHNLVIRKAITEDWWNYQKTSKATNTENSLNEQLRRQLENDGFFNEE